MKFSLIVCTLGRKNVLFRLFDSLCSQTYKNFEIILVDQNDNGYLVDIVNKYVENLNIKHLNTGKGLSLGRNIGLEHAKGDIVAFPDDDCWYEPDLLKHLNNYFEKNTYIDGVTSYTVGKDGKQSIQKYNLNKSFLTKYNVWKKANSNVIFLRLKKIKNINLKFDENIGVGANTPWGSGEEIDFLLSLISKDFKIYFNPDFFVYHPHNNITNRDKYLIRNILYAQGAGYVMKKNDYSILFFLFKVCKSLIGSIISMIKGDIEISKIRFFKVKGLIKGWTHI